MSGAANLQELLSTRFRFNSFDLFRSRQGIGNAVYLVNGCPVSGGYLSMIPLSAVERVEVLDEGPIRQSSYGIAITVNIVLRKDFEGFDATARSGLPSPKGMDSRIGRVFWGGAPGHGRLTIGAVSFGRDELRARDRDFGRAMYTPGGSFTD